MSCWVGFEATALGLVIKPVRKALGGSVSSKLRELGGGQQEAA